MKSPIQIVALLGGAIFLLFLHFNTPVFANSVETKTAENSEESIESLYPRYIEYYTDRKYRKAGEMIKRMLEISEGGIENILKERKEEYPVFISDLVFDYGNCLIQQKRWEEARDCFRYCVEARD